MPLAIREKIVGKHNHVELTGPATVQVVNSWERLITMKNNTTMTTMKGVGLLLSAILPLSSPPTMIMLVKPVPGFGSGNQLLINSTTCINDDDVDEECGMIANEDNEDRSGGDGGGAVTREEYNKRPPFTFGNNNQTCISMHVRLDCHIFGSDRSLLSQPPSVESVPYLASLECFCNNNHYLTA
ncbi:hypothetical protein ACHAXA_009253, partial [Cyclostephanos tholiformis]